MPDPVERDPRSHPIPGDVLRCGHRRYTVLPARGTGAWVHVTLRDTRSTRLYRLRDWRRMMADPEVVVVRTEAA